MRPAHADAAIAAVQVHHAVGPESQFLVDLAGAAIDARIERVGGRQFVLYHQAGLLLLYGLARVEGVHLRHHLARILVELRARQPTRILRQWLVEQVDDAGEGGACRRFGDDFGIELRAPGSAVVAKAVG